MRAKSALPEQCVTIPVVGLIGCGHIGRFHSRNLRGSLRSELVPGEYVAVCDRDIERAERFAGITGATTVSDNPAAVFDRPNLNTVYICTETAEHPQLVIDAAARGLNVFCEKPLAKTLGDVRRMVDAVEAAGVVNQVGLVLRYSPVFTVLKDLMSDPGLGPLLTAHLRDDQFFPVRGHYGSSWRGSFESAGGGTLIEHSIHDIDLFHWLFGDIETVRCHTRETTGHSGVEDVAIATFQHTGGHQTSLSSIWHSLDDRPSTRHLEVFFEGGYFAADHDFIGPIRLQGRSGEQTEMSADEVFQRYCEIAGLQGDEAELARRGMYEDFAFLRCVHEGREAFPDFRTALQAHEVVDACYRSAERSREVSVRNL
jgi:predicted dehydrogenase